MSLEMSFIINKPAVVVQVEPLHTHRPVEHTLQGKVKEDECSYVRRAKL